MFDAPLYFKCVAALSAAYRGWDARASLISTCMGRPSVLSACMACSKLCNGTLVAADFLLGMLEPAGGPKMRVRVVVVCMFATVSGAAVMAENCTQPDQGIDIMLVQIMLHHRSRKSA